MRLVGTDAPFDQPVPAGDNFNNRGNTGGLSDQVEPPDRQENAPDSKV
ncbi:hypothetical protein [Oryzibacter oryziterrae]|nr:hypothetical protein [Oryzibacter oryziterrae]